MAVDYARINNTLGKMDLYFSTHNSICVSVSGGSDSDIIVHMISTYFRKYLDKVHFVFANTGLEYAATIRHLDYLEDRYDIHIDRIRGVPIPVSVRKNGMPFISKRVSDCLARLDRHNFTYEENPSEDKYPGCSIGIRWWNNSFGEKSMFNINRNKLLKEFLILNRLPFKASARCCDVSKKNPLKKFERKHNADMIVIGVRKSEGGARVGAHSSCFETDKHGVDKFMPLWFWDNDTKLYYKESEGIKYSDCYEIWGMKRTGCVGFPFAVNRNEELEIMKTYEPNLYKACMNVFGDSYKMTDAYREFRKQMSNQDN